MNGRPRHPELVLASSSVSRRALLERLGLPFSVQVPNIDESPLADDSPERLVERLSRRKATVVSRAAPDALVIGSDQVAVLDGRVSGKPGTEERAIAMLTEFSGQELEFLTGLALLAPGSERAAYLLDRTRVTFRPLKRGEIVRYVHQDQPLDCAGCFRLESMGPVLFESVRSQDPTALMGLPLIGLARLLREAGVALP